jgi:CubicO group peptidase (beta-lactamase class C family)
MLDAMPPFEPPGHETSSSFVRTFEVERSLTMEPTEHAGAVTSANWIDAPHNRWGFRHVAELTRTATISRGDGPLSDLPRTEEDLGGFPFSYEGREISLAGMLEETYTDAFLVIRRGRIVFERYFDGMAPEEPHLLMSVSKSLTSILCGALVAKGALTTEDLVVDHVEELRGTSWEGCTVQALLDMRAGTAWDYDIDEYDIFDISDYRTHDRQDLPPNTAAWISTIGNSHAHGTAPFRYISLVTDVLAWVLERAGGASFVDLFSREVWSRIGAESDATIIIDRADFPVAEGGISTTLRDLGRFGLMCLREGQAGDDQVVPRSWLGRLRAQDQDLVDAFVAGPHHDPVKPVSHYHDKWWVWDAARGIYKASGMHGQAIVVHHPSETVVVKFSTFPSALDSGLGNLHDAGISALCESFVAGEARS